MTNAIFSVAITRNKDYWKLSKRTKCSHGEEFTSESSYINPVSFNISCGLLWREYNPDTALACSGSIGQWLPGPVVPTLQSVLFWVAGCCVVGVDGVAHLYQAGPKGAQLDWDLVNMLASPYNGFPLYPNIPAPTLLCGLGRCRPLVENPDPQHRHRHEQWEE